MITLSDEQKQLAASGVCGHIVLVVMRTYDDKEAETGGETFYWSHAVPIHYNWKALGTDVYFRDVISDFTVPTRSIGSTPSPSGFTSRSVFAGGMKFGDVGAYEKIHGRLFYAVDATDPAIYDQLADIYWVMGEKDAAAQARATYDQLLAWEETK